MTTPIVLMDRNQAVLLLALRRKKQHNSPMYIQEQIMLDHDSISIWKLLKNDREYFKEHSLKSLEYEK